MSTKIPKVAMTKKMGVIAIIALLIHNVPNYNKRKNSAVHL